MKAGQLAALLNHISCQVKLSQAPEIANAGFQRFYVFPLCF
jgi:hypothetical protein